MDQMDAQATNGGHIIERIGDVAPVYLSEKLGRDYGAGQYGGWTTERDQATEYTQEQAEAIIANHLPYQSPFCKVVAK